MGVRLVGKQRRTGYLTLSDDVEAYYHASTPRNDPTFAIQWPFEPIVISEKDAMWPLVSG